MELLLDANLVVKHQFGKNIAQFERAFQCLQHDHLVDMRTGRVIEFCDPRIQLIIKTACEMNNFTPSHHTLYIYGYSNDNGEEPMSMKSVDLNTSAQSGDKA
jgi:Fur family ferric uptake transcriptional regulator